MVERRPPSSARAKGGKYTGSIDWYLMQCCTGIEGLCPPLCTWAELNDGTYNICDVEMFNQAMTEMVKAAEPKI